MRAFPSRPAAILAALPLVCAAFATLNAAPSSAFTANPLWKCRASALQTSINGNNRVEPIVANGNPSTADNTSPDRAQCANEEAGADNLATPLGISTSVLGAQTASAKTTITPETGQAIDQKVESTSRVENLTIPLGGTSIVLGVAAANSDATGSCSGGTPQLNGTSQMAGLTLGGTPIPLDGLLGALQNALGAAERHRRRQVQRAGQDRDRGDRARRAHQGPAQRGRGALGGHRDRREHRRQHRGRLQPQQADPRASTRRSARPGRTSTP